MQERSPYVSPSTFESCPAATGDTGGDGGCTQFPDGAHRCGHMRRPVHSPHVCTCGAAWSSVLNATNRFRGETK